MSLRERPESPDAGPRPALRLLERPLRPQRVLPAPAPGWRRHWQRWAQLLGAR